MNASELWTVHLVQSFAVLVRGTMHRPDAASECNAQHAHAHQHSYDSANHASEVGGLTQY